MRALLSLLIGLMVGFGGATWFYGRGGNVIVNGYAVFPPLAAVAPGPEATAPMAPSRPAAPAPAPARREPRVVVRDVTDEVNSPPPPAAPAPPAAGGAAPAATAATHDVTRYELGSLVVVLVPKLPLP
jgi:hypothetical protein